MVTTEVVEAEEVSTTKTKSSTSSYSPEEKDWGLISDPNERMFTRTACVAAGERTNGILSTLTKPPDEGFFESMYSQFGFAPGLVE